MFSSYDHLAEVSTDGGAGHKQRERMQIQKYVK